MYIYSQRRALPTELLTHQMFWTKTKILEYRLRCAVYWTEAIGLTTLDFGYTRIFIGLTKKCWTKNNRWTLTNGLSKICTCIFHNWLSPVAICLSSYYTVFCVKKSNSTFASLFFTVIVELCPDCAEASDLAHVEPDDPAAVLLHATII